MTVFERLLHILGISRPLHPAVQVDQELITSLKTVAAEEDKPVNEVVQELLHYAVAERNTAVASLQLWEALTPREKQTAALACLGCTNHEIAEQMVISPNTVKTHVRHVLNKFNVNSKSDLRTILSGWDFRAWIQEQNLLPPADITPTSSDSSNRVSS